MKNAHFRDRVDAGRTLAQALERFRHEDIVVIGLPRGGVVVAYEIAHALAAPLDVCVVRKLGAPMEPELGIGAVAEGGAIYVNRDMMRLAAVSDEELGALVAEKNREVDERVRRLRRGMTPIDFRSKTVLVVDDGVATGGTVQAALRHLRTIGAHRLVLAVPVGASESLRDLAPLADEIICPYPEDNFVAVGLWYDDFAATTDDDVVALLSHARADHARGERPSVLATRKSDRVLAHTTRDVEIALPSGRGSMGGTLDVMPDARGLVAFAHGSGSSRYSVRNRYVAGELQRSKIATLLFDLLTEEEERTDRVTAALRFDIGLLASRLVIATDWLLSETSTRGLKLGYFGASTGAAAALVAASRRSAAVTSLVSRGGRPDLAGDVLPLVSTPTLLVVGGDDTEVLELNREAFNRLRCEKSIEVVPGASHLFEEPGTLEIAAHLAARWFCGHFAEGERAANNANKKHALR
ncbi:MAG: phosphoribosyltransferase [Polyangiaceae bacterium]|nr:phosphoribosyltransferase [Polyangiaceae bacterium]